MMDTLTLRKTAPVVGRMPADRLRDIAERCAKGEPLDRTLARWLGNALNDYLRKNASSLEEALGLRYGRGGVPWWREAAIRERDEALRALSKAFFADLGTCHRARRIAKMADRYADSAWRIDKTSGQMPASYTGTPKEFLWRAFRSGAAMPLGERQIRNITAGD